MKRVNEIANGLKILAKYDRTGFGTCAEHDIIFAGPDEASDVTKEDQKRLLGLNWFIDDEVDRWAVCV